jgi:hypothetical protein
VRRPPSRGRRRHERSRFRSSAWDFGLRRSDLRSSWVGWGREDGRATALRGGDGEICDVDGFAPATGEGRTVRLEPGPGTYLER